jgi:uracil-DNA glycosylase family 4
MKKLSTAIKECDKCGISLQTTNKSIGRGSLNPKFLFVGLNPGKEENNTGRPFCGPSGKLLDRWVEFLGIRPEEYAVVNLIRCFTNNEGELQGDEAAKCIAFTLSQIKILQPSYIVPLGAKPAQFLLESKEGITKMAGRMFMKESNGPKYIPLTHPAYWLRKGGIGWEPMLEKVKWLIDDKTSTSNFPSEIEGLREIKPIQFQKKYYSETDEKVDENQKSIIPQKYVPLHIHTTYSVTDSVTKLDLLAETAKEKGFSSIAITDHGTIGGWVEFQQQCNKYEIKPILGVEFYVTKDYENKNIERMHIVVLAKDELGIKNIFRLNNKAHLEGFYYKPRILLSDLIEQKNGLVILSACVAGVVAKPIVDGNFIEAEETLLKLKNVFGEDFYLELQPHNFDEQLKANPDLIEFAEKYNVKMVVTTDSHYIRGEERALKTDDQRTHNALKAIAYHKKMGEGGFTINTNFLMTDQQMIEYFEIIGVEKEIVEEGMKNTFEVAEKCNAQLKKYKNALPRL